MRRAALAACILVANAASAADYRVCPSGCAFASINAVLAMRHVVGGDTITVEAGGYGAFTITEDDAGAAGNPVRIVGVRDAQGARPRLSGGTHTVKFQRADHVVLEGFEITGGSATCVFNEAHDVTVRDVEIHHCPAHGILGADQNSGSFTLEYSEVHHAGAGQTKHALYIQSDEVAHGDAVFRMRWNFIHDGNGGNLLKSRHQRSEIYYNWFEGATFQELELIGPDVETQQDAWTEDLRREDADVVGNVIVHTSSWPNAVRAGGDLNGRSKGLARLVNNTFVFDGAGAGSRAVLVQLGLLSLQMHNNAIFRVGGGAPIAVGEIVVDDDPPWGDRNPWVSGRRVSGSRNAVESGATNVPPEWTETRSAPDFTFTDLAARDYRPLAGSVLIDTGQNTPTSPPGLVFPNPLLLPTRLPPMRAAVRPGMDQARIVTGVVDIGAFELGGVGVDEGVFANGFE